MGKKVHLVEIKNGETDKRKTNPPRVGYEPTQILFGFNKRLFPFQLADDAEGPPPNRHTWISCGNTTVVFIAGVKTLVEQKTLLSAFLEALH